MSLSIGTMHQEYFGVYPLHRIVAYVIATLLPFVVLWLAKAKSKVPILNPKRRFEATSSRVRQEFMADSIEIMKTGRALYPHEPYRAYTDFGNVLVLPPELLPELKSHPNLDFITPAKDDSHAYVPGFEPFGGDDKMPFVITKYLTKALTKLTRALSEEATLALRESLTDSPDWHEINPTRDILSFISRLSSRVFMGEDLCRNKDWIEASSKYTAIAFSSSDTLRQWSRPLRPIVHWFLSDCRETRRQLNVARSVLRPLLAQRQMKKREAEARGETSPVFNDSLEWFEKEYSKGYDPATSQITLSLVAIHTTSDLLQVTMFNIARHPELFGPLREEIQRVLASRSFTKQSLQELKLMDSVIKESQRLKPILLAPFRRLCLTDIKLSNGWSIRKGEKILVASTHMQDSAYYDDPLKFDGYRFMRMRQTPGEENNAHLVSTSEKHIGFGHGQHACPGRFFAANEVKIALCHLLLKYDWKLPDGHDPKVIAAGMALIQEPNGTLAVRRRVEEIDLDSLSEE